MNDTASLAITGPYHSPADVHPHLRIDAPDRVIASIYCVDEDWSRTEREAQIIVAALQKGSGRGEAASTWVRVQDRLPVFGEGRRVVIYTDGYDFAGEQFFHIKADDLYACDDETLPRKNWEVASCASHWIYEEDLRATIIAALASPEPSDSGATAETPNPSPDVEKLIEEIARRAYEHKAWGHKQPWGKNPWAQQAWRACIADVLSPALQSLSSENARLKEERDEARAESEANCEMVYSMSRKLTSAEARIKELEKALEPFAKYMGEGGDKDFLGRPVPDDDCVGWIYLTHADFRRARAALTKEEAGNA